MLMEFPQGFGFDPTFVGASNCDSGTVDRTNKLQRARSKPEALPLPVVLVADELIAIDPRQEPEPVFHQPLAPSPFLTTAVVGFLLAGAGYFVGFH